MDTLPLLAIVGASIGGAVAGAVACYWPLSRVITELRRRLEHSEHARAGAVERSAQAREQIAQLNSAITELRRTHAPPAPATARTSREDIEKALAAGDARALATARPDTVQAFADTQVMHSKL